jgi:type II secretory pathway pseudopilin PulG
VPSVPRRMFMLAAIEPPTSDSSSGTRSAAVTVSTRVREESGFGLVELLVAMTVMVVGITALVAAMSSGFLAVNRAAQASTAAAVADIQMEGYRALTFASIAPTCAAAELASTDCWQSITVPGPDGRNYPVDKGVRWDCAVGTLSGTVAAPTCTPTDAARPAKLVTIVVHDPAAPAKTLFRATSTFDQATG